MIEELKELVKLGYVRCQRHNSLPLTVYNYTQKTQYESALDTYPILYSCRGLVLDDDGNIAGRGFNKFKNRSEILPNERIGINDPIEISDKMDGSLLILFKYKGQIVSTTRGSFNSEQKVLGEKMFYNMYDESWIEDGKSYLFEVCSPENRIVCWYPSDNLVMLAILDTQTGQDLPRDSRFNLVKTYPTDGVCSEDFFEILKAQDIDNAEGFVIRRLSDNRREKIKFGNYCIKHKHITGMSTYSIYEMLRDNLSFDDIIELIPDELFVWLSATKDNILRNYSDIESKAKIAYEIVKDLPTRKDQAVALQKEYKDVMAVVFKMLDNYDPSEIIWKMVRPAKFVQPFANKGEE